MYINVELNKTDAVESNPHSREFVILEDDRIFAIEEDHSYARIYIDSELEYSILVKETPDEIVEKLDDTSFVKLDRLICEIPDYNTPRGIIDDFIIVNARKILTLEEGCECTRIHLSPTRSKPIIVSNSPDEIVEKLNRS